MEQAEVKYAPGMRIIVRGEEWMVKKVETNSLGNQTLYVIGLSQLVKDYESMFLVDVENDIEIVDPAKVTLVPDDSAFFRKSKVYIESQWRSKIPTDNKIHIGNKAAMDLMSYQLEPAQMALNKTRQRILIADTVGLGKTLEAGILMSELIARGKGKRILVVTVKSMMTQFQKEMWNRFTIPLVRLDSSRIQSVRAKLPTNYNPFFYYDKTIISVDTLKNDLDYRTHLENAWWDIIVIDEAHNVAKRGDRSSQRSKLASLLANRSDTLIMLKGDARIMEILVKKEEQALKNIGDPAMLFGKFNQEEEEEETAKAIESGAGADAFEKLLDSDEEEFDPLELLMGLGDEKEVKVEYSDEETLFSDIDYLKNALDIFTDTEEIRYSDLSGTQGVEIKLTDNVKKRIKKLIPPEAMPSDDYLRLSPDREYCLNDMKRCMQNDLAETAWSATQYLWKLHPIFNWIEDKAGVFYKRSEVPVLGLTNSIGVEEILFIVAGLIPNRKSTTVVDEWFGLLYKNGQFDCILSMSEVLQKTHLNVKVPNTQNVSEEQIARGQKLLGDVVDRVKKIMADKCAEYKEKTDPYIYEEMERLEQLEQRHKDAQLTIFDLGIPGMERKKSEKEREIEAIFTNFMDWEKDTLEIEENPYIRIIAVVTGVI